MDPAPPFELGRALLVRPAPGPRVDMAVLAYGTEVYEALRAIEELEPQGYRLALYDARFAKPVDLELIRRLLAAHTPILTIEDHALIGGFGTCVLEACDQARLPTHLVHRLGMPERWIYHDSRDGQLQQAGLDAGGIARAVRLILDRPAAPASQIHVDVSGIHALR
jgi:1-deoxy-D-xylulose-5-phosphate synthase